MPWLTTKILKMPKGRRVASILALFIVGGLILETSAEPFLRSMEAVAASVGLSSFFFIQWCAPLVSEFPEKVTAFQWARKSSRAPMALLNMISSNIVQWTIMAGMIPIIYSISIGTITPIEFDTLQEHEILLTILQSFLSILFLMDLEMGVWNATGLLLLWAIQFFLPSVRESIMVIYGIWMFAEIIILAQRGRLTFALMGTTKKKKK